MPKKEPQRDKNGRKLTRSEIASKTAKRSSWAGGAYKDTKGKQFARKFNFEPMPDLSEYVK